MKSLVQGGVTAILSGLLCSTVASASPVTTVKAETNVPDGDHLVKTQLSGLNNHIAVLSEKVNSVTNKTRNPNSLSNAIAGNNIDTTKQPIPATVTPVTVDETAKAASILPADTPLLMSITIKSEVWQSLSKFQLFQSAFDALLQYVPPTISSNYKYLKYAQSLLGDEIVLAFLPATEGTTNLDSKFLGLIPIKDSSRLPQIIQKFSANKKGVIQREYKGVTIIEWENSQVDFLSPFPEMKTFEKLGGASSHPDIHSLSSSAPQSSVTNSVAPKSLKKPKSKRKQRTVAIASIPGYLVIGMNGKAIEQLIDVKDGNNPVLADEPQYQKGNQNTPPATTLVRFYENPVAYVNLIKAAAKDPSLSIPSGILDSINTDKLKLTGRIHGLLFIQPEGLRLQMNTYPQPGFKITSAIPASEKIFPRMPASTYSAFISRDLNLQWQLLSQGLSTQLNLKEYLTSFRNYILTSTKLDLDKDIFGWMDGDYAFFLYPTKGGLFKIVGDSIGTNFNLGIGVMIQTNNRSTAETTFNKLDQLIKSVSQDSVKVNTQNLKGQSVISWDGEGKSAQSFLAYTWVDDKTVMITTGLGAMADLVPEPYLKLPSTYNFQTATKTLPSSGSSYFYANMGSSMSWIYGMIPPQYKDNLYFKVFQQSIGSIYSISAASSATEDKIQLDLLTVLAPTKKPAVPIKN